MALLIKKVFFYKSDLPGIFWTLAAALFLLAMVYNPQVVFVGGTTGLEIWWKYIFPSLLPFFIASELLLRLGFVRFMGVLLEPVMRPFFKVPGEGAFVMIMGLVSGSPINGLLTARLYQQDLCSKTEAHRLLGFTNFTTPMFMLSVVAVGMLEEPALGLIILGSQYLANLLLGLGLRFYGEDEYRGKAPGSSRPYSLKQALRVLVQHQRREKQPFGKLLNEVVAFSAVKMVNIGGYVVLFAVIIQLFKDLGIMELLAAGLGFLLFPLGFSAEIINTLAVGMLETTISTKMAAQAAAAEWEKLVAIGIMLGWAGFSVHAQVASMLGGTDLSLKFFIKARLAHAVLAAGLTWLFYDPERAVMATGIIPASFSSWYVIAAAPVVMILLLLLLLLTAFICWCISRLLKFGTGLS